MKLCPSNSDIAHQVISKARLLRKKKDYDSMYICPDRTVEERKAYRKLLEELKTSREAEPDIDKFFVIRNGKVVRISKDSRSAPGVDS